MGFGAREVCYVIVSVVEQECQERGIYVVSVAERSLVLTAWFLDACN